MVKKTLSTVMTGRVAVENYIQALVLLAGLLCSLSALAASQPDNFHRVTAELYRSAQPSDIQMHALQSAGIRTVLNLRQWHSDSDEAQGTSLILYHVSMNTVAFTRDDIVEALRILHRSVKPVLVHCWHGSDRTGLIIALYEMVFDHASRADVLAQLRRPEYGYHKNYFPRIARYIETVNVDALRQQVLSVPSVRPEQGE